VSRWRVTAQQDPLTIVDCLGTIAGVANSFALDETAIKQVMLNFAELNGQLKIRDHDVFEKALRYVLEYSDPLGLAALTCGGAHMSSISGHMD
jgi:hypothetical protein